MRNAFKKSLSVILALLVVLSALPISVFAAGEDDVNSTVSNISTSAVNALGEVLAEPFNSSGSDTGYSIGKIDFVDMVANVALYAPDNSTVLVCIYDESNNRMVTSGKAEVNSSTEEVSVELAECELPEYFVIKGYIVDENNVPVSNIYENIEFTKRMEDFHSKTVEDFDPAYVINLDAAIDNNFAVVDSAADVFETSSTENTIVIDDFKNGKYVFSNATTALKSVAIGDIVFVKTGEGPEDFILTKVGSVTVDGSTVEIKSAESAEPDELFQFIKFDTTKIGSTNTLSNIDDTATNDEFIIPVNLTFALTNKDKDEGVVVTKKCLDYNVSGTVYGNIKLEFKYYHYKSGDVKYFENTRTIDVGGKINVDVSGTFGVTYKAKVESLPFYGFQVFAQLSISFSLKGKAKTELKLSYKVTETYIQEMSFLKGKYKETATSSKPEIKLEFTENIKVEASVKLTAKAGISFIKVLKAYLVGSVELKSENTLFDLEISDTNIGASFPFLPWSAVNPPEATKHPCDACIRADITLELRAGVVLEGSLNMYEYDEELEEDDFDFGVSAEPIMVCTPVPLGDFRVSLCNGKFEFEKTGDNSVCPHQEFLVAFLVVQPNEKNAPVSNETVVIETDETTLNDKDSVFYNPNAPKKVTITTDSKGLAKTYLPKGIYSYNFKSDNYETLPASASRGEFIIDSSPKEFKLDVGKLQEVTINVVSTGGSPVKDVDVNGVLTDANGKAVFKFLKGTHKITAKYKDETKTINVTVKDSPIKEKIILDLGYQVTCIVKNKEGKAVQGIDIKGEKTDSEGKAVLWLKNGNYTIKIKDKNGTATKYFVVNDKDVTIEITLETYMEWSLVDGHLIISGVGPMTGKPWESQKNLIKKITINDGITTIYVNAFENCTSLTSITIPNSVTSIGPDAFAKCNKLTSVTIPDSVTSIGDWAFCDCESLTSITIPGSVTSIGDGAFIGCFSLLSITTDSANDYYSSVDGVLFNKDKTILINYPIGKSNTLYTIPNSVTSIGDSAFRDCKNLTSITIPNSVTSIGGSAFSSCDGFTSITIPSCVTSIGSWAFADCDSLTSITIPGSVTTMGSDSFSGCDSLTSVTILYGVSTIGYGAFDYCRNLLEVTIPKSVKTIENSAFYRCENLQVVYYAGTSSQWYKIKIGSYNQELKNKVIYNSTGKAKNVNTMNLSSVSDVTPAKLSCDSTVFDVTPQKFSLQPQTVSVEYTVGEKNVNIANVEKGNTYILYIAKSDSSENFLSADNLLYVSQEIAKGDTLTIPFELREKYDDLKIVITTAKIVVPDCEKTGHIFTSIKTNYVATCEEDGSAFVVCRLCGHIEYRTIFATGHSFVTVPQCDATCTKSGYTAYVVCENCNEIKTEATNISAKGHTLTGWIIDQEATVTTLGAKHKECTVCGKTIETATIPQLKPATPKVTTTNEIGGVQVKWNAVAGATKYVVYRRQGGYKTWVNVGTTTGTTLLDKNVKSGIYYVYSVRAYNSAGQYSDFVSANTQTRKYMATPKLTTIYNHANGLAIKWNAVAGVTNGYRVYRRGAGSTYWTYLGTTKNLYFIDSGVKNASGGYYRYTVIADGGYHSKFDTTGLYLKRLANPTLNSATSSTSGITVKWGAVKGTTGYYVYRKTASSIWTRVGTVGGTNNTTFLDKTAKKGTTYTYTVRAVYGSTTSSYNSGVSCYDKY